SVSELSMITGSPGWERRIEASVASPSISGISTSSVTTSGALCPIFRSAIFPLEAVAATSSAGSELITSDTIRRTTLESSTTRTRIFPMAPLKSEIQNPKSEGAAVCPCVRTCAFRISDFGSRFSPHTLGLLHSQEGELPEEHLGRERLHQVLLDA